VPHRLGQREGGLGGLPGLHAGQQRPPLVVCGVPVVGQPPQLRGTTPAPLDARGERAGVGGMQGAALDRQQVVVDRLLHQGVPEGVGVAAALGHQDVVGDRLAQQLDQALGRLRRDLGEQLVVDPPARHGGDLEHPLGRLGQRLHPRQHQLAQDRREPGALQVCGQQLLGEERVALRASQDLPQQRRRRRLVEDPRQQPGQVTAVQPAQFEPLGPAAAVQLAQERPQRVRTVQLI
jgi:hypothetical protein